VTDGFQCLRKAFLLAVLNRVGVVTEPSEQTLNLAWNTDNNRSQQKSKGRSSSQVSTGPFKTERMYGSWSIPKNETAGINAGGRKLLLRTSYFIL
jgi:hypothetical protein